jgi:hypothetical protein
VSKKTCVSTVQEAVDALSTSVWSFNGQAGRRAIKHCKRMEKFEKLLKGGSASSIEVSKVEFGTE